MSKHTPGPWIYVDDEKQLHVPFVETGYGECVIVTFEGSEIGDTSTNKANYRLMAASPDLLAALLVAKDIIHGMHKAMMFDAIRGEEEADETWKTYNRSNTEMKIVNAAIAKVT